MSVRIRPRPTTFESYLPLQTSQTTRKRTTGNSTGALLMARPSGAPTSLKQETVEGTLSYKSVLLDFASVESNPSRANSASEAINSRKAHVSLESQKAARKSMPESSSSVGLATKTTFYQSVDLEHSAAGLRKIEPEASSAAASQSVGGLKACHRSNATAGYRSAVVRGSGMSVPGESAGQSSSSASGQSVNSYQRLNEKKKQSQQITMTTSSSSSSTRSATTTLTSSSSEPLAKKLGSPIGLADVVLSNQGNASGAGNKAGRERQSSAGRKDNVKADTLPAELDSPSGSTKVDELPSKVNDNGTAKKSGQEKEEANKGRHNGDSEKGAVDTCPRSECLLADNAKQVISRHSIAGSATQEEGGKVPRSMRARTPEEEASIPRVSVQARGFFTSDLVNHFPFMQEGRLPIARELYQKLKMENSSLQLQDCRDRRYSVLSYEQVTRLSDLMNEEVPIHGRGNFPTLEVKLVDLVVLVRTKLEADGVSVKEIRLNGSGASSVLASNCNISYNDLDLIFTVDLPTQKHYDRVKQAVLDSLLDLLPEETSKKRMSSCTLKEAYVSKMVKVNDSDRWSLIALGNNRAKSVELKFVDRMKRKYEFSVDSFHIMLDTLFLFYDCANMPISDNFYPTVVGESVYGNFEEALNHLHKKLIATKQPEEIRGGGLLKYCNLLVKNYRPALPEQVKSMERYMCSRFFIDFPDLNQQHNKLVKFLDNHFQDSDNQLKYDYLMILYQVVDESTVCLMGHERRQTLALIEELSCSVYSRCEEHPANNQLYHCSTTTNHSNSTSQAYTCSTDTYNTCLTTNPYSNCSTASGTTTYPLNSNHQQQQVVCSSTAGYSSPSIYWSSGSCSLSPSASSSSASSTCSCCSSPPCPSPVSPAHFSPMSTTNSSPSLSPKPCDDPQPDFTVPPPTVQQLHLMPSSHASSVQGPILQYVKNSAPVNSNSNSSSNNTSDLKQQQPTLAIHKVSQVGSCNAIPTYEIITSCQPRVLYSNGYYFTSFSPMVESTGSNANSSSSSNTIIINSSAEINGNPSATTPQATIVMPAAATCYSCAACCCGAAPGLVLATPPPPPPAVSSSWSAASSSNSSTTSSASSTASAPAGGQSS